MKVLLLDNFDSFTFNLFHYLEALDCQVSVIRNNQIELNEIAQFDKIVLSPGPGLPKDAGKMMEIIKEIVSSKPILGVCLGMQALAEHFGGELYNQQSVKHGVSETCKHNNASHLFKNIPVEFEVGLYHSWAVNIEKAENLIPTSYSQSNTLMSFEHKDFPIFGVQFHPESLMTPYGKQIIENFLFM